MSKEKVIVIETSKTLGKVTITSSSHKVVNEKGEVLYPQGR